MIEEPLNVRHHRCRAIYSNLPGLPILFLHGYNFTSDVWRTIGVLELLEKEKIPFLALDMPYGAKSSCSPHTRDPEENVLVVREAIYGLFGKIYPLIVGASLGGYIALKYAVENPVSGLLLIAPVYTSDEELVKRLGELKVPAMIIWGSKDEIVSRDEMEKLAELLEARLIVYEGARHAAYLDKPEEFKRDLLAFYKAVRFT